jgi:hypothetical protein
MSLVRLARLLTETPLARGYERGGRLAKKRPSIPWAKFDRSRYSEPALALSYDAASKLAKGEYSAIELFSRLTAGLAVIGAPLDLIGGCAEIPNDELRHADIALRFAALCKGEPDVSVPYETGGHARHWTKPPDIEEVDRTVIEVSAIGETLAFALLSACLERATDPVARAMYATIVADEVHHARLGWYYLAWRSPQWSRAERQRIANIAGEQVFSIEERFSRGRDAPAKSRAGARALGVLETKGQRATVKAIMSDEVVPALDALGLGASHAWRKRRRVKS